MNDKTIVTYETQLSTIVFQHGGGLWPFGISEMQGASSLSVTLNEMTAIGQAGSTVTGRQVQARTLIVNGYLLGEVEQARKQLLTAVAIGQQAKVSVKNEQGEVFYIYGEPVVTPEIKDGVGVQEFQFQFKCAYPYWKTDEDKVHSFKRQVSWFKFPHYTGGAWYITKMENEKSINARNEGNIRTGVTMKVKALLDFSGPLVFENINTGEYIEILHDMKRGDLFEICTEPGKRYTKSIEGGIEKNGYYRIAFGSSLQFGLMPGDNMVAIRQAENLDSLEITILAPKGVLAGV